MTRYESPARREMRGAVNMHQPAHTTNGVPGPLPPSSCLTHHTAAHGGARRRVLLSDSPNSVCAPAVMPAVMCALASVLAWSLPSGCLSKSVHALWASGEWGAEPCRARRATGAWPWRGCETVVSRLRRVRERSSPRDHALHDATKLQPEHRSSYETGPGHYDCRQYIR
eukprot:3953272-Prymnesium_polylepis.1